MNFDSNPAEYFSTQKITVADAHGAFKFKNLADGDYYIVTTISWHAYDPYHRNEDGVLVANYMEGGRLMQRVTVSGGGTQEIVLTQ